MWQMRFQKVSTWDIAYAVDMSIACLITYWLTAFLIPYVGRPATPVGILWAVISTVFVYKDTRSHSLSAGISRLVATLISFLLCLSYLSLFPITSFGMAGLIAIGTLITMSLGRRDDIGLTAITTAVVMIVAASEPQNAWLQPLLRLCPLWVISEHSGISASCPLYPRKRTWISTTMMSALCRQKRRIRVNKTERTITIGK
jgi:hypothetical protein